MIKLQGFRESSKAVNVTHQYLRKKISLLEFHKIITLGEGMTLKVFMILSGYSSRILEIKRVPIPDPVPPPREWASWKPCKQSQLSASFRTTSNTVSTSSAPSV